MFHKVIVGFDGSERALDALLLGEALAAPHGELVICCVHHYNALSARIDPTEPRIDEDAARETVKQATRGLERGLIVIPVFLAGAGAAPTLAKTAITEHADLIVLGSSHRRALGRVFVGSVTQELLHEAPCPVAVAPVGFHDHAADERLRRIAVGYDVREPVPRAVAAGIALAEQNGAGLRVVAVADDAAIADPARATMLYAEAVEARIHTAEQAVAHVLASVPQSVPATGEVRDGETAEQLLKVTRDVDLMVLGSHGRGLVNRLIMGSVCDAVVRAAECAVLVIPPEERTGDLSEQQSDAVAGT